MKINFKIAIFLGGIGVKYRPKFFYIGRRYNIDYLWFMLSPLRWFILVPIRTPPLWVSATSTISLFLFLSSFLLLFFYGRLASYSLYFFCTSVSFFLLCTRHRSFFLSFSLIHLHTCIYVRVRAHKYTQSHVLSHYLLYSCV